MKENYFKFRESFADLVKGMTDKQAGEFIKAVGGYVFDGKPMESKDDYLKGVYLYAQSVLDTEARDRANGRLGGVIMAERYKELQSKAVVEQTVCESSMQLIIVAQGKDETDGQTESSQSNGKTEKTKKRRGRPKKSDVKKDGADIE